MADVPPDAITRAMYEVRIICTLGSGLIDLLQACEDAAKDGVRYLEVRFSPILHVNEGASLSSVMEAVCGAYCRISVATIPLDERVVDLL